jgi:putative transcriptional regulator
MEGMHIQKTYPDISRNGAMIKKQENFPELVKDVRSQLGLSQEDLAHALGVSFATVNRWENAKTSPSKLALRQFNAFCKSNKITSTTSAGVKKT